jgi:hypothetical protein
LPLKGLQVLHAKSGTLVLTLVRFALRDKVISMPDEIEILRAKLKYWLDRWEAGCRWFAVSGREADARAFGILCDVADGWCEAMTRLDALSPGDPFLIDAQARLDAVAADIDAISQAAAALYSVSESAHVVNDGMVHPCFTGDARASVA